MAKLPGFNFGARTPVALTDISQPGQAARKSNEQIDIVTNGINNLLGGVEAIRQKRKDDEAKEKANRAKRGMTRYRLSFAEQQSKVESHDSNGRSVAPNRQEIYDEIHNNAMAAAIEEAGITDEEEIKQYTEGVLFEQIANGRISHEEKFDKLRDEDFDATHKSDYELQMAVGDFDGAADTLADWRSVRPEKSAQISTLAGVTAQAKTNEVFLETIEAQDSPTNIWGAFKQAKSNKMLSKAQKNDMERLAREQIENLHLTNFTNQMTAKFQNDPAGAYKWAQNKLRNEYRAPTGRYAGDEAFQHATISKMFSVAAKFKEGEAKKTRGQARIAALQGNYANMPWIKGGDEATNEQIELLYENITVVTEEDGTERTLTAAETLGDPARARGLVQLYSENDANFPDSVTKMFKTGVNTPELAPVVYDIMHSVVSTSDRVVFGEESPKIMDDFHEAQAFSGDMRSAPTAEAVKQQFAAKIANSTAAPITLEDAARSINDVAFRTDDFIKVMEDAGFENAELLGNRKGEISERATELKASRSYLTGEQALAMAAAQLNNTHLIDPTTGEKSIYGIDTRGNPVDEIVDQVNASVGKDFKDGILVPLGGNAMGKVVVSPEGIFRSEIVEVDHDKLPTVIKEKERKEIKLKQAKEVAKIKSQLFADEDGFAVEVLPGDILPSIITNPDTPKSLTVLQDGHDAGVEYWTDKALAARKGVESIKRDAAHGLDYGRYWRNLSDDERKTGLTFGDWLVQNRPNSPEALELREEKLAKERNDAARTGDIIRN